MSENVAPHGGFPITATLYVRKNIVPKAIEMSSRYKKLWVLMQKLSKVNWELLLFSRAALSLAAAARVHLSL